MPDKRTEGWSHDGAGPENQPGPNCRSHIVPRTTTLSTNAREYFAVFWNYDFQKAFRTTDTGHRPQSTATGHGNEGMSWGTSRALKSAATGQGSEGTSTTRPQTGAAQTTPAGQGSGAASDHFEYETATGQGNEGSEGMSSGASWKSSATDWSATGQDTSWSTSGEPSATDQHFGIMMCDITLQMPDQRAGGLSP